MGVAIARNAVNSLVSESATVMNVFSQTCSVVAKNTEDITFGQTCRVGGNVNITVPTGPTVSQSCIQTGDVNTSIKSVMRTRLQQKAQAMVQTLGIGVTASENFLNTTNELADEITNHFTQTCFINVSSNFVFNCEGTIGGNVTIIANDNGNFTQQCQTSYSVTTSLQNRLVSSIMQQSSATVGADAILVIIIFVGLIFMMIVYFSLQELTGPVGYLIIFLVLGSSIAGVLYAFFAPTNKLYPYNRP